LLGIKVDLVSKKALKRIIEGIRRSLEYQVIHSQIISQKLIMTIRAMGEFKGKTGPLPALQTTTRLQ